MWSKAHKGAGALSLDVVSALRTAAEHLMYRFTRRIRTKFPLDAYEKKLLTEFREQSGKWTFDENRAMLFEEIQFGLGSSMNPDFTYEWQQIRRSDEH